jgi:hypothetical protein
MITDLVLCAENGNFASSLESKVYHYLFICFTDVFLSLLLLKCNLITLFPFSILQCRKVNLTPLSRSQRQVIAEDLLGQYNKRLDSTQVEYRYRFLLYFNRVILKLRYFILL